MERGGAQQAHRQRGSFKMMTNYTFRPIVGPSATGERSLGMEWGVGGGWAVGGWEGGYEWWGGGLY